MRGLVVSMTRRVVITGCGVMSPIGCSKDTLWESLRAGRSGVASIGSMPTETMPVKAGGEVRSFTGQIDDFGPLSLSVKKTIRKGLKVMCREIQMGVAAAQWAISDAHLDLDAFNRDRIGVIFGSDYIMTQPEEFAAGVRACLAEGSLLESSLRLEWWPTKGMPQVTPLWLLKYLPNMPACHVAIYNDLRGPNDSLTVREASSNLAIGEAYNTIQRGAADVIVTGATGSRVHPLRTVHTLLQEEIALGDADPHRLARPFDQHRTGMVIAEGAATVILEDWEFARRRGAPILGEVIGYGSSCVMNAQGQSQREQALVNVMRQSLAMAGIAPEQLGHLHAHGVSTRSGDIAEARAIRQVCGGPLQSPPVVAAKSYFGNLGAASGMVELIASLMAMQSGQLFTTLNYDTPDPECDIAVVTDPSTPSGETMLNLNVTPQGQAGATLVRLFAA
jgi:3-oxoacyl-[acyl-carrier-protein] synthase II